MNFLLKPADQPIENDAGEHPKLSHPDVTVMFTTTVTSNKRENKKNKHKTFCSFPNFFAPRTSKNGLKKFEKYDMMMKIVGM